MKIHKTMKIIVFIINIVLLNNIIHELLIDIATISRCTINTKKELLITSWELENIRLTIERIGIIENRAIWYHHHTSFKNIIDDETLSIIKKLENKEIILYHSMAKALYGTMLTASHTANAAWNVAYEKELLNFICV